MPNRHHHRFRSLLHAGAALAALSPAIAVAQVLEAPEVVVSATRIETPPEQVGSSVTVIDGRDIERRGKSQLLDALQSVPGVTITRNGGVGAISQIRVRGADPGQTQVLIDGVQVNDPSSNDISFNFDALLATGTTTASVFPTVHAVSVDALFEAAQARGMRLIGGKVLMDRHAPDFLVDDVDGAERECRALIERWHGRGRCAYAVTPRFAPTSTDAQLAMAGRLLQSAPGLYMQTHVAENRDEVAWVAELFPEARSYLDVYAHHGLLTERAILAHGIWLDDADRDALREAGAQIAHCPSSNLFLGSGLFDWALAREAGVNVSFGCDVGGGTSLSMLRTMADAYKVQAMLGRRLTAWQCLYAATLGAARALRLESEIGSFALGTLADLAVWDWARGPVAERRHAVARDLHDRLFAWMTLGDERNLAATYVAGVPRFLRPSPA